MPPQVLALNKRIQAQNRAPLDFPNFVRNGFDVKVLGDEYKATSSGYVGAHLCSLQMHDQPVGEHWHTKEQPFCANFWVPATCELCPGALQLLLLLLLLL
jgi:hypothetical protein